MLVVAEAEVNAGRPPGVSTCNSRPAIHADSWPRSTVCTPLLVAKASAGESRS